MAYYNTFQQPKTYTLVTDSATEPLTLAEVKTHLRIDGTDYDAILEPLIKTVRQLAEKITGRDFINKTWKTYIDCFPSYALAPYYSNFCDSIEIKKSKLSSITSIKYYIDDVLTTLSSSIYYITDVDTYSSIYLDSDSSYPATDTRKQAVEIIFVSGYGADATFVPEALKQAMLSHITFLYENAGDCVDNGQSQFKSMYLPYIIYQNLVQVI